MRDTGQFDWDDLRLLIGIADAGSMTGAAFRLGVSQPTLGRRLKALESRLGASLFDRLPNCLELTAFGSEVVDLARTMERTAIDLSRLAQMRQGTASTVHISATSSVAMFLVERLDRLPDLADLQDIHITISSTRSIVDLARREADIALRMRGIPLEGSLRTRKLARVAFTLYGLLGAHGSGPEKGALFIGLTDDRPPPQRPWLDDFVQANGGSISHRLGEVFLRHRAIGKGLGISLLPCFIGDRDASLERIVPPPQELDEDIFLLMHQDVNAASATARVAEGLRLLFRNESALLCGSEPNKPQ